MAELTITKVRDRFDLTSFLRLPYEIYRDDPSWVPPLESERRRFLSKRHNPFLSHAKVDLYIAKRGRRVVGRVAAVIDPRYHAVHGTRHGFFGLFECADDQETATALLDAAANQVAQGDCDRLLGPMNLSANAECGLLVDGFADRPTVLMPYNPPYYADLIGGCGFLKSKDLLSWRVPDGVPSQRVHSIAERASRLNGVRIRQLHTRRSAFAEDVERIKHLYNSAWEDNWGFVPMADDEFHHLAAQLRPVLRPELALLAFVEDEPVGFALALPDVNQALKSARGRLTRFGLPIGLLRVMRAMRGIDRSRLVALGVAATHRGRGIETILCLRLLRASQGLGYREHEISWTLEDNVSANRILESVGAARVKTHRLFERAVAPACRTRDPNTVR